VKKSIIEVTGQVRGNVSNAGSSFALGVCVQKTDSKAIRIYRRFFFFALRGNFFKWNGKEARQSHQDSLS
jgi:hypothetical protein